jgi:hypothetical protein
MDMRERYLKKRIYVKLNNNRVYSGVVDAIDFLGFSNNNYLGQEVFLFTIIDKFGKYVSFSSNEILLIEEEENNKK